MQSIRCGQLTVFYDPNQLAVGGKVKIRVGHANGESTDVEMLAFDLFGLLAKFTSEMTRQLDVLQREMEKAQA